MDMSPYDMRQAGFWLRRWRLIGGIVTPRLNLSGLSIDLHRTAHPDPEIENIQVRTAEVLEQELRDNPVKRANIAEIARARLHEPKPRSELEVMTNFLRLVRAEQGIAPDGPSPGDPPNAA